MMLGRLEAAALFVAVLVLTLLTPAEAGCISPCNQAPDHSKAEYCIARPNQNCQVQLNTNCPPCSLWQTILKVPGGCNKFYYSGVHPKKNDPHPEWIIMPCEAVSGIEAILEGHHAASTNFLWAQAWGDAVAGSNGRAKISPSQLGLVINSFYYRSEHQMHIHAAQLDTGFAKYCLGSLPPKIKTTWASPTDHTNCAFNMISKHTASLNNVNSMIVDGAKILNIGDNKKIGALVSQTPSSSGSVVTVFEGIEHRGDHDILFYNKS